MRNQRPIYAIAFIILLVAIFQFFLRFQYIQDGHNSVVRVDRLSGSSCVMPCVPPSPTPAPTPYNKYAAESLFEDKYSLLKQHAIELTKNSPEAASIVESHDNSYEWNASNGFDDFWIDIMNITPKPNATEAPAPSSITTPNPVILVCYCDKKDKGWRWEAHADTGQVFFANGNFDLEKKYGLTHSK
jgi:hypothetical protein